MQLTFPLKGAKSKNCWSPLPVTYLRARWRLLFGVRGSIARVLRGQRIVLPARTGLVEGATRRWVCRVPEGKRRASRSSWSWKGWEDLEVNSKLNKHVYLSISSFSSLINQCESSSGLFFNGRIFVLLFPWYFQYFRGATGCPGSLAREYFAYSGKSRPEIHL